MPNGQPLFLDNSSALTHLLLCFPSFDYPGWATCKEIECSLSLFSYEMTALFLKVPCSSLVPSECGRHVRRTALNASSGPQPVILVLQSQRCDFYTGSGCREGGGAPSVCASWAVNQLLPDLAHLYNQNALFCIAFYSIEWISLSENSLLTCLSLR